MMLQVKPVNSLLLDLLSWLNQGFSKNIVTFPSSMVKNVS